MDTENQAREAAEVVMERIVEIIRGAQSVGWQTHRLVIDCDKMGLDLKEIRDYAKDRRHYTGSYGISSRLDNPDTDPPAIIIADNPSIGGSYVPPGGHVGTRLGLDIEIDLDGTVSACIVREKIPHGRIPIQGRYNPRDAGRKIPTPQETAQLIEEQEARRLSS